jgi:hypothetical protein
MSSVIGAIKIDDAKRAEVDAKEAVRPPNEQDKERAIVYGARVHQLEADLAKMRASNERMTRSLGQYADENVLLRHELGGDVTERVRAAAYRVVQADVETTDIVCVNTPAPGEWRAIRSNDAAYGLTCETMMDAVDERAAGE